MKLNLKYIIIIFLVATSFVLQAQKKFDQADKDEFNRLGKIYNQNGQVDDSIFEGLLRLSKRYTKDPNLYPMVICNRILQYQEQLSPRTVSYSDSVIPILVQYPLYFYLRAKTSVVNYYIDTYQYEKALKEIKLLQENNSTTECEITVNELMGDLYFGMDKLDIAYTYYFKCVSLQAEQKYSLDGFNRYESLLYILFRQGKYKQVLEQCTIADRYLESFKKQQDDYDKDWSETTQYDLHCYRLGAYSELKDTLNTKKEFAFVMALDESRLASVQLLVRNTMLAIYFRNNKEYERSLNFLNKSLIDGRINIGSKIDLLKQQTLTFAQKGDYKMAYQTQKSTNEIIDSVQVSKFSAQINELRTIHEVDRLTEQTRRIQLLMAFSIAFFLIIVLTIYQYSRRLKVRNRGLFQQIKEQDRLQNKLALYEKSDSQLSGGKDLNEPEPLYDVLQDLMEREQLYIDPNLTRDQIAALLSTNRTYLIDTIRENTGLAFVDYLNNYRLDYARSLLTNKQNLSIKEIYQNSGFTAKSTFYRLFQKRFGLTPSELRELLLEE